MREGVVAETQAGREGGREAMQEQWANPPEAAVQLVMDCQAGD